MIAQYELPHEWRQIDHMTKEELVSLIVSRHVMIQPDEIENRLSYSDPLTLKRLAFLAQLQVMQREDDVCGN